mmetsp:Transcript_22467/g.55697  ORF Transcript_22467/g.55697 Transcript_22467/m.55697 type:complete len:270 (-) Transcript_22467:40-849(-)
MMGCPRLVRCCRSFVCFLRCLSFCWRSFSLEARLSAASSAICLASSAFFRDFSKGSIFFGLIYFISFTCLSCFESWTSSSLSSSPALSPPERLSSISQSTLWRLRSEFLSPASSSSSDAPAFTSSSFHPSCSSSGSPSSLPSSWLARRFRLAPVPASIPSCFMSLRYFRRAMDVWSCFWFFRFLNSSRARTCPFFWEKSVSPTAFADRRLSALCCCRRLKPELVLCRLFRWFRPLIVVDEFCATGTSFELFHGYSLEVDDVDLDADVLF